MNVSGFYRLVFTLIAASAGAGSALAQEPPPGAPPPVGPSQSTPLPASPDSLKLQPNEIALWGQVAALDVTTGQLELQARGFELPNGRKAAFAYSKDKTVRLAPDATLLNQQDLPLALGEVKNGHWVFVIGVDEGSATSLNARLLRDYGENAPSIVAPVLPEHPLVEPQPVEPEPELSPAPWPPVSPAPWLSPPPATPLMTLADISPWLREAARLYPAQMQIQALSITAQGRPLLAIEIRPLEVPAWQLRRLAVICRQHGDEPETTAAGVEFIRQFLMSRTPHAQRLRQEVAVLIVPVANPDGAWRKRRLNGVGQDLNRDWGRGRSREVSALMTLLAEWQPHLVVDVHQWVPGDSVQTPMAEASGGSLGRRVAAAMTLAARALGLPLAYRTFDTGGSLCHRYWGGRSVPAILLETIHRPGSPRSRQVAIATSVTALQKALEMVAGLDRQDTGGSP